MQSWRLLIKLSESVSTFRIVQKMWLQWPFFYTCTKRFGIEEVYLFNFTLFTTVNQSPCLQPGVGLRPEGVGCQISRWEGGFPLYSIVAWLQWDTWRDTSLSVQNDLTACRRQIFLTILAFERAPSTSLSIHNDISACRRQEIFGLFAFERAPSAYLSVHNNIGACLR